MAECNIDKSCFDDVKMCVKVNSVNGIKPNADGEVDIDEKFVTTNTKQTIHGSKTFTNTIKTNGMNREAMLTTMNGLTIDTAPTVINKSSIKWNDKEQNEVSSIEVSRPANTKDTCISLSANTITEWGSNEKASVEVHAKAGATSYATAPTPSSNATGNEIVTAKWVIDKGLADDSNVVHKTGNETINGTKTFTQIVNIKNNNFDLTVTPSSTLTSNFIFKDKNDQSVSFIQYAKRNIEPDVLGLYINDKDKNLHGIQITSNNYLLPMGNNIYNLGSPGNIWANAYIANAYTNRVTTYSITHPTDDSYFFVSGGTDWDKGANLFLYGSSLTGGNAGSFELVARNATQTRILTGYPNGSLTWGGKNVALDDNVVHRSGDEIISGIKSFSSVIYLLDNIINKNNQMDLFKTPANTLFSHYIFVDKNNEVSAYMQYAQQNTGTDFIGLFIHDKSRALHGIQVTTNNEVIPIANNTYSLGSSSAKWANVYASEINTKYFTYTHDSRTYYSYLPKTSGTLAIQERTRASSVVENRTLLYECAGGLDKGDITLNDVYTKFNALLIVYSDDDGDYMSTYYLDCAELDIRRDEAGSGTFLLVDGHSYWACTGASTGTKFVHATNNGLRIHKIYGLAKYY